MFGRHAKPPSSEEGLAVDATLERDIGAVEQSVETYLQSPTDGQRGDLRAVLERLDEQIALGDEYSNNVIGSAAYGYSTRGSVLGETSCNSIAEDVPSAELQAQVALVKAAKREVTEPTPDTLAALRAASEALTAARTHAHPQ